MTASIFVATPTHDGRVTLAWAAGALQMAQAFPDAYAIDTIKTSILPTGRDALTHRFIESGASHMLCVDADIGWNPGHVKRLLSHGRDFVSGVYATKTPGRLPPISLNGAQEGSGLLGASGAPGGFLLLSRACIEAMTEHYRPTLSYVSLTEKVPVVALWAMTFPGPGQPYDAEDFSFCRRWRQMGGEIWIDPMVELEHHGDAVYKPIPGWVTERLP